MAHQVLPLHGADAWGLGLVVVSVGLVVWPLVRAAPSFSLIFRRPGSRAFLQQSGWAYYPKGRIAWARPFALPPLSAAQELEVTDFAWASIDGVTYAAFVAWLSSDHLLPIEVVDLPAQLPPLEICLRSLDDGTTTPKTARSFLTESAEFNARWVVRAASARYASAVLTPRFIERLLDDDANDMTITIDGGALVSMTWGAVPNDRVLAHLAVLRDLVATISAATLHDFGAPSATTGTWTLIG